MKVEEAAYLAKPVEDILKEFCDLISNEVIEQLKERNVAVTEFIFSHYNIHINKPQIFVIKIRATKQNENLENILDELVTYDERSHLKIVTDGQDSFVDRLIFGSLYTNIFGLKKEFLNTALKVLKPKKAKREELTGIIEDYEYLKDEIQEDVFRLKFRELSLQEAVDLATLLIKIVMDIQVYTEKIPTVGGLIRLAVIHKDSGFKWISGHEIIPPKIIQ